MRRRGGAEVTERSAEKTERRGAVGLGEAWSSTQRRRERKRETQRREKRRDAPLKGAWQPERLLYGGWGLGEEVADGGGQGGGELEIFAAVEGGDYESQIVLAFKSGDVVAFGGGLIERHSGRGGGR